MRETVEAVRRINKNDLNELTELDIARKLQLDKSTASRRIRAAISRGFLENLQDKKGRPARIVLTDQVLPDNQRILPTVDELQNAIAVKAVADSNIGNGCTVADETENTASAVSSMELASNLIKNMPTLSVSAYAPHSGTLDQADI